MHRKFLILPMMNVSKIFLGGECHW
jgi:hypothetical protein